VWQPGNERPGASYEQLRGSSSVGKSLAYGALGGLIQQPLDDSLGFLGARANVKGFLCEYMTAGRVLVMGDLGPWSG
jgi:hypothetical protein